MKRYWEDECVSRGLCVGWLALCERGSSFERSVEGLRARNIQTPRIVSSRSMSRGGGRAGRVVVWYALHSGGTFSSNKVPPMVHPTTMGETVQRMHYEYMWLGIGQTTRYENILLYVWMRTTTGCRSSSPYITRVPEAATPQDTPSLLVAFRSATRDYLLS